MSGRTMLGTLLGPGDGAIEHVVARYQRVAPAVTRFARSLSGNDRLTVRLGSEPAVGPDEVVCDPRLFRAAYEREAPVTPEEVALASALHEVVHLLATRLDEKRTYPADWPALDEVPSEPIDLLDALHRAGGPVAETLFFAIEDARQELRNLSVYPGARSVLSDIYQAAYPGALRRASPLAQFTLACFLVVGAHASRADLEARLERRANAALTDGQDLLLRAAATDDPWQVAGYALGLLEVARRHGLLDDVRLDTRPGEEQVAAEISDAVDRVRLISPVVRDASSYREVRRSEDRRPGPGERNADTTLGADPSTDQILRVSTAPTVYLPTGQSGKLIVVPAPSAFSRFAGDGRRALAAVAQRWEVSQRRVSGELYPLFAANQRRGLRSGYDQGDVSPHAPLFIGAGLYTRMYERRAARTRRRYAVSLLVDGSASMLQPRPARHGTSSWGMSAALLGAWTLAALCDELQIDFEVALFNRSFAARPDDTEWSYTRSKSQATAGLRQTQGAAADRLASTVNHYLVKPFDRRWRDAEDVFAGMFWTAAEPSRAAAAARRDPHHAPPVSMFEKASNVDELNVSFAAERMSRLGTQVRVLVVLADGMTRGSVNTLARTVDAIERTGTTVLGIGIGDDTVTSAYARSQVVDRPDELTRSILEGVRRALRRSLALWGMDAWWLRPTTTPGKETLDA